jgi:hypothetical protein
MSESFSFCGRYDSRRLVLFLHDRERLRRHGVDVLGAHARQVRPHLVGVLLAEVGEQHRAVRALGRRQPAGQDPAADPAAVAAVWTDLSQVFIGEPFGV